MIQLPSSLENQEGPFIAIDRVMNEEGFVLGGGYEYDHACYDKVLDWETTQGHQTYLRIPVIALSGSIGTRKAQLQIGQPFVLKHPFKTGPDTTADAGLITSTFSQFSDPADKDDYVEQEWLDRARCELTQLEKRFEKEAID
ncbi:YugN family protein [Marininema halotolerans]|uniref:YugN-like family protein n=1 Tax=Marininema halotolerans TaxID=1155944 RepID=A0A1I6Q563_9BACL|nr:YugN family protein [Marininema halotolerans]SFS47465.1 YugN-like family protein [Marininema halotolerans]